MFVDRVILEIQAGNGGNGIIAWRREKYIPKGGPYGGDGGRGGSVCLVADHQIASLEEFRYRRFAKAENGKAGGANQRKGRNGRDLILKVPPGTLVKDGETGELLFDFTEAGQKWTICHGGKGGYGNAHFKSPTNRAPVICTFGKEGQHCKVELELKLIADVGLVGFPNAGKSTLLNAAANVPVKMAPYPFTTLRPHLGYVYRGLDRFLMADIPGIIEGASCNRGLGFEFLRHIERTQILVFVLDSSGIDGRDPGDDFAILQRELKIYDSELLEKPYFVVLNKIDTPTSEQHIRNFKNKYHPDILKNWQSFNIDQSTIVQSQERSGCLGIFEISALTGEGLKKLLDALYTSHADKRHPFKAQAQKVEAS